MGTAGGDPDVAARSQLRYPGRVVMPRHRALYLRLFLELRSTNLLAVSVAVGLL